MGAKCNDKSCSKMQVIGGLCATHARKDPDWSKKLDAKQLAKRKFQTNMNTDIQMQVAGAVADKKQKEAAASVSATKAIPAKLVVPENFEKVTNVAGESVPLGVEMSFALVIERIKEIQRERMAAWACALSSMPIEKQLEMALSMLRAEEALGY